MPAIKDTRIESLETSPDIFVTLKPGWRLEDAHCFGEDSIAAVRRTMRRVKSCQCESCRQETA